MPSIRATVLLEAATRIHALREKEADRGRDEGLMLAVKELKRMASEAHDDYKKKKAEQRRAARASDAKWGAFGPGL
jgi:hypothetical protein